MGKLYQLTSPVADFQKATFSFFFAVPSSGASVASGFAIDSANGYQGGLELLVFGDPAQPFHPVPGYGSINLTRGDSAAAIGTESFFVATLPPFTPGPYPTASYHIGRHDSTAWNLAAWFNGSPDEDDLWFQYSSDYDDQGLAMQYDDGVKRFGHLAYLNSPFTFDTWHHAFIAADLAATDTYGNFQSVTDANYPVPNISSITRARKIEIYLDGHRVHGIYAGSGDLTDFFNASLDWPDNMFIPPSSPPIDMRINGLEFSLPTFHAFNYNPAVRYAEFQAWFGTYIDPAVHIAKFIDSHGRPVDPAIPQLFFGRPQYRFRRNKKLGLRFNHNEGSAGAMVAVGTIADFGPGPP